MLLQNFAESDSGIHISLKAEPLFHIGPLEVTNAMLYGFICSALLVVLMIAAARKITVRPQKGFFRNLVDYVADFVVTLLEGPFGNRETAARFAPYFGVYFFFIIFSNLLGPLPVVGEAITFGESPLFRPFTADLNGTIALAVIAILMVQYLSIKEQGAKKHLQHYFSDKPKNPINLFIGVLEVFGEFTRVISLSLRLFLNTAVGEILIAVFTSMVLAGGRTPLAVLPIILFEGLVAFIQAYVFTVLAGTYLGLAIAHAHGDSHDNHSEPLNKVETTGNSG
ncbi:MAG: F-type H+-transporting ATPase subunit a [Patescibacteria group bacterium]|nr:F-type H+-transporting ATPase subunit a [Patescibacteria group bacterium]